MLIPLTTTHQNIKTKAMKKILLFTKILIFTVVCETSANIGILGCDTLALEEIEKAAAMKLTNVNFTEVNISLKDEFTFWESKESPSIYLVQSVRDAVYVLTAKKNVKYINAKIEDGELFLKKDKDFHITEPDELVIFIETKNLAKFKVDGLAEIETIKPLKTENLSIDLNGFFEAKLSLNVAEIEVDINGIFDVKLKGSARVANFDVNGIGEFNSSKLIVENLTSDVSGIGDASFHATQSAYATGSGLGNISIKGNPKVLKKNVSGLGSVNF